MATTFVIIVNHWAGKYAITACHVTSIHERRRI